MKIAKLKLKDFLIFEDVEISPDSKINYFIGPTDAGKTSIIKAIKAGIKGINNISMIRNSTDKTEIAITFDSGENLNRSLTIKGNKRAKVTTSMGDFKASPQAYLDSLIASNFIFDPMEFLLLENRAKSKYLRELFSVKLQPAILRNTEIEEELIARIDFDKDGFEILKGIDTVYYDRRSKVNHEVSQQKALLSEVQKNVKDFDSDTYTDNTEEIATFIKKKESDLSDARATKRQIEGTKSLLDRITKRLQQNEEELGKIQFEDIEDKIPQCEAKIEEFEQRLKELKEELLRLTTIKANRERLQRQTIDDKSTMESLPQIKDMPDIDNIEKELSELHQAEENNKKQTEKYKIYQEAKKMEIEYKNLKEQSDKYTEILEKLRKDIPAELSKQANIPISGLEFKDDTIFVNGISIENMATSKQITELTVPLVIAASHNKPLKTVCLDRCESLDDNAAKLFADSIPDDFQFFITTVYHKGQYIPPGAFWVENGNVSNEDVVKKATEWDRKVKI